MKIWTSRDIKNSSIYKYTSNSLLQSPDTCSYEDKSKLVNYSCGCPKTWPYGIRAICSYESPKIHPYKGRKQLDFWKVFINFSSWESPLTHIFLKKKFYFYISCKVYLCEILSRCIKFSETQEVSFNQTKIIELGWHVQVKTHIDIVYINPVYMTGCLIGSLRSVTK